tara:strand:+ start:5845 stop:6126 length:282 start_codon:yes stop_codon:yes gene_type:complete
MGNLVIDPKCDACKALKARRFCEKCDPDRHILQGQAYVIVMKMKGGGTHMNLSTLDYKKSQCLWKYEKSMNTPWPKLYREGDRCVRVSVTPQK